MRTVARKPGEYEYEVFDWQDVTVEPPIGEHFTANVFRPGCLEAVIMGCSAVDQNEFAIKRGMEGRVRFYDHAQRLVLDAQLHDLHGQVWRNAYARLQKDVRELFTRLGIEVPMPPVQQVEIPEIAGGLLVEEMRAEIREKLLRESVEKLMRRLLEDPQWHLFGIPLYLTPNTTLRLELRGVPDWCNPRITLHGFGKFAMI